MFYNFPNVLGALLCEAATINVSLTTFSADAYAALQEIEQSAVPIIGSATGLVRDFSNGLFSLSAERLRFSAHMLLEYAEKPFSSSNRKYPSFFRG